MNTTIPLGNNPEHTQLGGRNKKRNGHKDNCKCPICINMKYAKRSKKKRGGENEDEYENMEGGIKKRRKSRKHKHTRSKNKSHKKRGGDGDEEETKDNDSDDSDESSNQTNEPGTRQYMPIENLLEILQTEYGTTARDLLEAVIEESSFNSLFYPEDDTAENRARRERIDELHENIQAEAYDYRNYSESGSESEGGRRRKSRKRRRNKSRM